jgi:predicted alternative tryptophan synthase beta-subunit
LEPAEWYLVKYDLPLKTIKLSTESTEDEDKEEILTNILEGSVQNTSSGGSRKLKITPERNLKIEETKLNRGLTFLETRE